MADDRHRSHVTGRESSGFVRTQCTCTLPQTTPNETRCVLRVGAQWTLFRFQPCAWPMPDAMARCTPPPAHAACRCIPVPTLAPLAVQTERSVCALFTHVLRCCCCCCEVRLPYFEFTSLCTPAVFHVPPIRWRGERDRRAHSARMRRRTPSAARAHPALMHAVVRLCMKRGRSPRHSARGEESAT